MVTLFRSLNEFEVSILLTYDLFLYHILLTPQVFTNLVQNYVRIVQVIFKFNHVTKIWQRWLSQLINLSIYYISNLCQCSYCPIIINRIYVLGPLVCPTRPTRLRGDLARLLGAKLVAPIT